ncbi:MAG TPA: hypothetical protein VKX17_16565 [Planctomycetota bacterium]|nr:hypothetical protein [Planctomycetota bacterium]
MFRIKVGAPAAMILAAAVTTAVSSEAMVAPQPGLPWALHAGAPISARATRAFLAHDAANQIRNQDRISGATGRLLACAALDDCVRADGAQDFPARVDHTRSTYQHAAP